MVLTLPLTCFVALGKSFLSGFSVLIVKCRHEMQRGRLEEVYDICVCVCVHIPVHISLARTSIAFVRFLKGSMTANSSEPLIKILFAFGGGGVYDHR